MVQIHEFLQKRGIGSIAISGQELKMAISEEQKRIAVLLMHEPKTVEELNKQLAIPYDKLESELRDMLKKEVVSKSGFPTKYSLKTEILSKVKKRKEIESEDTHKLRLKIIIEGQAIDQDLLKRQLDNIEASLRKEPNFTIYDLALQKIIKEGEHYSSYLDVNLSVKDFRALMRLLFHYGPTSIEVIKPTKIEFTAGELQDGLVDASSLVQGYNEYIIKLLNKKELSEFYSKLFDKKA